MVVKGGAQSSTSKTTSEKQKVGLVGSSRKAGTDVGLQLQTQSYKKTAKTNIKDAAASKSLNEMQGQSSARPKPKTKLKAAISALVAPAAAPPNKGAEQGK